MDIFQAMLGVINPTTLLFILLGVTVGELVGILPGISSPAAVALLLPATYGLPPTDGLAMLAGIWYGSAYGGIITSVLLNIPGEGDSVIATLDGYQMAKQGKGALALGVSAFGGFFAGTIALIALQFVGPGVADAAVRFGPQEFFALMFFGLALVSWLSGKSIVKGMISAALGLLIGTVGLDIVSGEPRLTFDQTNLLDGIGFVPAVVGLFGLGEILHTVGGKLEVGSKSTFNMRGLLPRGPEWGPEHLVGASRHGRRLLRRSDTGRRTDQRDVHRLRYGEADIQDSRQVWTWCAGRGGGSWCGRPRRHHRRHGSAPCPGHPSFRHGGSADGRVHHSRPLPRPAPVHGAPGHRVGTDRQSLRGQRDAGADEHPPDPGAGVDGGDRQTRTSHL